MIFHILCPGSGGCWRLGLRFWFCAHTGGVQGQEGCGGSGSWDRAVFLDFLDFAGAFWLYLTSFVKYWIVYWIYEIYVDLLIEE